MTVASEITRLQTAKADIRTAIQSKWVTVPASAKLDTYDDYIAQIQTGSAILNSMPIRYCMSYTANSGYRSGIWCPVAFIYGDYMFWTMYGSSYNSSVDYFEWNFMVYKAWWSDIKYRNVTSSSTRDARYWKTWWYSVNWDLITIWVWYSGSSSGSWPFSTLTATFNMSTGEWTGSWTWSTADLTEKWNELFSSIEFDPRYYNFYGTTTPVVIFHPIV